MPSPAVPTSTGAREAALGTVPTSSSARTAALPCDDSARRVSDRVALAWAIVLTRATHDEHAFFGLLDASTEDEHGQRRHALGPLPQHVHIAPGASAASASAHARTMRGPDAGAQFASWLAIQPVVAVQRAPAGTVAGAFEVVGTRVLPRSPGLAVTLYRRPEFVDVATARALLDSLLVVLAQLDRPEDGHWDRPVAELEWVPEAERTRMLVHWNATARAFPEQLRVESLFEAQVAARPGATAVEDHAGSLTFAELDARAEQLACALRARGVVVGTRVALYVERSSALVVAMLGVLKAGGCYVPMDPAYPLPRLAFMWEDSGSALVVTEERLSARVAEFAARTTHLTVESALAGPPVESRAPEPTASSTDLAYVIYTSGSTGQPNGVAVSHRAVLNTLDWVNRELAVGPSDRLLFVTSPCFDLSVYDVFGALGAGATVVVASEREVGNPQLLRRALIERSITVWDSAPAAFQVLLAGDDAELRGAPLRLIMLSGDWVPLPLARRIRALFPAADLQVLGGATEAAIWSNSFRVTELDPRWKSIPYGRPIQNAGYYVLDDAFRPVPWGVPGHLFIGGVCLAEGYANRAELTARRFVVDALGEGTGRLYRTGDLARFMADGNLEFLGRSDFQIKVRGYRIELGELENALAQLDGVAEAVCGTYRNGAGELELCAYLVLCADQSRSELALRRELRARLPAFMVPARILVLPALPLSSNGKIDRKALPPPSSVDTCGGPAAAPAEGALEQALEALWARALGRQHISRHDDFFALGGQSLLAASLVRNVEIELGLVVDLAGFLGEPTLAGMARHAHRAARLTPLTRSLAVRHPTGGRPPLVVVGGGAFLLLQQKLAAALPDDQPVYFVRVPSDRGWTHRFGWARRLRAERLAEELCGAGLSRAVRMLGFAGTDQQAWHLAAALGRRGVAVLGCIAVDSDTPPAQHGAEREALWLRADPTASASPPAAPIARGTPLTAVRYPGRHLAFLAEGAASPVIQLLVSWLEADPHRLGLAPS